MKCKYHYFCDWLSPKFKKTLNFFLKKWSFFKRGLYRHVYWLNLALCGASVSKNLTNKKQKNLLYIQLYIYSSFFESKLDMVLMQKLWISIIWETHFKCSTQSEYKNELLDSFTVVNLAFWYLLCFYRTRYYGLPLVNIMSYFQHITRSVTECCQIHFQ